MKIRHPENDRDRIAVHGFPTEDDAILAIQGLKVAGFEDDRITVAGRDAGSIERVAKTTGACAQQITDINELSIDADREKEYGGRFNSGDLLVLVHAGEDAEMAERVMHDGLVDGIGLQAPREEGIYMDPSSGSGAGVATSTGTAIGISPGAGYEPNTGSSVKSIGNPHGQFAPGANTPNRDDDFPG